MRALLRFTFLALIAAYAAGAVAQSSPPRGGKWEFTLQPQVTKSQDFSAGNGAEGHIDSTLGFGFGIMYNLNNHFSLGGDFQWSNASYSATTAPAPGNPAGPFAATGVLETSTIRFNAIWNFSASDFTPFLLAGIGSTYIDTNIPANPLAPPVCWWDPYWGYYCGTPTRTAYYVSFTGGAGVRWDLDRNIFLRAMFDRLWVDANSALGTWWVDQYRFDVGFKF